MPLPNLLRAIEIGTNQWSPETVGYGRRLASLWRVDKPLGWWVERLEEFEQAHRSQVQPPPDSSELDETALSPKRSPVDVVSARARSQSGTMQLKAVGGDDD